MLLISFTRNPTRIGGSHSTGILAASCAESSAGNAIPAGRNAFF
jgi:hypothetical protein